MSFKSVVLVAVSCLCCVRVVNSDGNNTSWEEPTGNIMGFSWKLPQDGGGGDSQCEQDIRKMYTNLNNMTLWAFQMWESTAGQTNGWPQGSVYQLGNFDECLGDAEDPGMERQYCLATVKIEKHPRHTPIRSYMEKFDPYASLYDVIYYTGDIAYLKRDTLYWGICSPASCSNKQLEDLLQKHIDKELLKNAMKINESNPIITPKVQLTISEEVCQLNKGWEPLGLGANIFFWVVGLSILAVLVASSIHCYIIHRDSDSEAECPRIVSVYSAIGHLRSLKKREEGGDTNGLDILWGIRFFSIFLVIVAHSFGTKIASSTFNRNDIEQTYHRFHSIFVTHGDMVVDSFFVLSGLLSFILILKKKDISFQLFIFYRYMRLITAYIVAIAFTAFILPLTGSGPTWPLVLEKEAMFCRENWWVNLIMLNNYVRVDKMCMAQSWYIPCDFHFFLLSLVVCSFFKRKSRSFTGLSIISILIVIAILTPALMTLFMRLPATLLFLDDFLTNPREHLYYIKMYMPSHTRAAPHLIGILTGYFIKKYHKPGTKIFSTSLSMLGALISCGVLLGVAASGSIFYEPNHPYSFLESTFYAALQRPTWAVALCCMISCCVFGHVPLLSSFLGWSVWVPLGKLVYGAYLIHMGLQIRAASLVRNAFYLDNFNVFCQSLGDAMISFAGSLLIYLIFEAPIGNICKILLSAKIELPKKHSVALDSYSPSGNDNKGLDLETGDVGAQKNNLNKNGTHEKNDQQSIEINSYSKNVNKL